MKLFTTDDDVVFIEGLTIDTVIGLYDWERKIKQPVIIDIVLYTDITVVATSNDLQKGVNYKDVCDKVAEWTKNQEAELVEDLAEVLVDKILNTFAVNKVTLKLGKPIAISTADLVGVQITRSK